MQVLDQIVQAVDLNVTRLIVDAVIGTGAHQDVIGFDFTISKVFLYRETNGGTAPPKSHDEGWLVAASVDLIGKAKRIVEQFIRIQKQLLGHKLCVAR